jgi:glycosyltransferase involved in cell wall biosynthesis
MNIVQINVFDRSGSTGRTCFEMQQYINSRTNNHCYTAYAMGNQCENAYRIGSHIEQKLHALFARLSGRQAFFSRSGTKKLLNYLDEIKPDIVHLRNLHSNYINLPILLRYLAKKDIATVVTLHDCWFYTGGCSHYTLDKCEKWKFGCEKCPRWKADKSWFFDSTKYNYQHKRALFEAIPRLGVVGVSDWITNEARDSFLGKAKKLCRIYNWIDLSTFVVSDEYREKLLKKYNKRKIILSVSSYWNESKGINDLIRLADIAGDQYELILIGNMEYKGVLPSNIDAVGAIFDPKELARYYGAADVFVTLSLQESFGKVSAEALACGTPVICVDSTANREIVEKDCGIVLSSNNADAIHDAISIVCKRGYGAYRAACRASAERRFEMGKQINEYIKLYEDLLSE